MAFIDGDDFVTGSILSFQQANRMKDNFRGASEPSNLQPGMCFSDSDDDTFYHMGASTTEQVLQETRSRDTDPELRDGVFRGLNIVTKDGAVVTKDGEVVFKGYYD
jgi:hypothetical protein